MSWLHDQAVTVNIPGLAVPYRKKMAYVDGFPRIVTHENSIEFSTNVKYFAKIAMGERSLFGCPLFVKILFHFPIMESWTKTKQKACLAGKCFPTSKPDVDNCVKAALDGCTKAVWVDDCQVTDLYTRKRYSDTPHTTIIITPLEFDKEQESLF